VHMKIKTWVSIDYFYPLLFHPLINIHHKDIESGDDVEGLSRQMKQEKMDLDVITLYFRALVSD
jgi:hypothetical protein